MQSRGGQTGRPSLRLRATGLMRFVFTLYLVVILAGLAAGFIVGLLQL
jgi:hypothetical protein